MSTTARLAAAEAHCERAGAHFTDLRRNVLEMILSADAPPTAYQLLDRLRLQRGTATPPTIYRVLEFLVAHGLIHRVERLNAFVGCVGDEGHRHQAQFLICTNCHRVIELEDHDVAHALERATAAKGFRITRSTIEVEGICADCAGAA
jgi:Fur family zinc uptake transcriptional regulator